jgi:tetratricopeptide (TPR) repeat protein
MKRQAFMQFMHFILVALLTAVLTACGSKPPASNAAATFAQTSMHRGATAFVRGDLSGARHEYARALNVYESLDDTKGRAGALLSLSRIASQSGNHTDALATVNKVLAEPAALDSATLVTAYGRAAAIYLTQGNTAMAERQLASATALCGAACPDAVALTVLRARAALAQQQPSAALLLTGQALAMPVLAASSTPTLKPQANAERANALRLRAQAQLALRQPEAALAAASEALQLDRALGLADRVLLDLRLLSQVHASAGSTESARHYQLLADRAESASNALRDSTQAN